MNDLHHFIGGDIAVSATGDLQPVSETRRGQQRVLRRLLTNPGEYIWHPEYGAGLAQWVGKTIDMPKIRALIRGQILREASVAKSPEPEITVNEIPNGVTCTIRYADAANGEPQTLSFNVNA